MFMKRKAFSIFILIVLMLSAAIVGAALTYIGVMTSYYNMPETTSFLVVENVVFPLYNATYFNVTILNPSNSALDINVTAIGVRVVGANQSVLYRVIDIEPALSVISRGTRQTFKCKSNWGIFAGETLRVEPVATNVSIISNPYVTPKVKLKLTPNFDASASVEYFNLTVENSESIINLTLSDLLLSSTSLKANVTPSLTQPYVLPINQSVQFQCNYNWESLRGQNVTLTAETIEGYEAVNTTDTLKGAIINVDSIKFDYTHPSFFNLAVSSASDSKVTAWLNRVNITFANQTTTLTTNPPLYNVPLLPNKTLNVRCYWDWLNYRNKTLTVNIYTRQGIKANKTVSTPSSVVWNITDVKFDHDYTDHFLVNITNTPCSLNSINVTTVLLNGTAVSSMNPPFAVLTNGTQAIFNCSISWASYIGKNANVTVQTKDGSKLSKLVTIPSVGLKLLGNNPAFGDLNITSLNKTLPYINVTISNSIHSLLNVTITKITIETQNKTYEIDGSLTFPRIISEFSNGYALKIGENVTIVCPWNYIPYLGTTIKVTVYTAEGVQVSKTWAS